MEPKRNYLLIILLLGLTVLSVFIYQTNLEKRQVKEDLIELSNIKYGLFNVDEWKKILANIISKKIEEFEVDGKNRKQLKKKISDFLYKIIGDLEGRYHEENRGSFPGFVRRTIARTTDIFGKIKRDIPIFSNQILDFIKDPNNKKALKGYLTSKLNEYADSTFAKMDYSLHDSIITKYKLEDRASTITYLNTRNDELQGKANIYKYSLMILALLTMIYILRVEKLEKAEFIFLAAVCFLFLVLGLTLPMIEIDARVSEIKLSLLGEQVSFQDQILYYKSKSILEVVSLMITQSSFDLSLVGILVFIFSVLFPLSKLISSVAIVSRPDIKPNKFILFLVHKTGKWSMADVMVVAIFMSYIGFSGILTEQLNQIENLSQKIEVLTTNQSSLQIGFFAFTSFVLLSLLLTNKLKKVSNADTPV